MSRYGQMRPDLFDMTQTITVACAHLLTTLDDGWGSVLKSGARSRYSINA